MAGDINSYLIMTRIPRTYNRPGLKYEAKRLGRGIEAVLVYVLYEQSET